MGALPWLLRLWITSSFTKVRIALRGFPVVGHFEFLHNFCFSQCGEIKDLNRKAH